MGGGNNVEIVPFGCFAKTRIKQIVVADPQGRGGVKRMVVHGDAAPYVGRKTRGGRECEQDLVDGGV